MRLSQFTELTTLDDTITELQTQLGSLYEQRKAIVSGQSQPSPSSASEPNLTQINLTLEAHKPLAIRNAR